LSPVNLYKVLPWLRVRGAPFAADKISFFMR
jgi:hypothetical protein